jgi:hypothetical protein
MCKCRGESTCIPLNTSTVASDSVSWPSSATPDEIIPKSSKPLLINAFGDGRCLFRCAAIDGTMGLQTTKRSPKSNLPSTSDMLKLEQSISDQIRNTVVDAILKEQEQIQKESTNLQFLLDREVGKCYASLKERITMMRRPSEYAGFLECLSLAKITKRQILLYEDNEIHYRLIAKFPLSKTHCQVQEPMRLLYTMDLRNKAGHFDLILNERSSVDYWNSRGILKSSVCHPECENLLKHDCPSLLNLLHQCITDVKSNEAGGNEAGGHDSSDDIQFLRQDDGKRDRPTCSFIYLLS